MKSAEVSTQLVTFALCALVGGTLGMALFPPVSPAADVVEESAPPAPEPAPLLLEPVENLDAGDCQLSVEVDGAGVANARLRLHQVTQQGTVDVRSAAPYGGGLFRFTDLAPATYHLSVVADGAAVAAGPVFTCKGDGERSFARVGLALGGTLLTGRVLGFGNAPAPGTELLLEQDVGEKDALAGVAHVPVAQDGTFSALLRPGSYRVLALAPHHTPETRTLRVAAEAIRLAVNLAWKPEASGVVVGPAGEPLAGAEVFVGPTFDPNVPPTTAVTDAEGRFTVPLLPGRPAVLAARQGDLVGGVRLDVATALEGHTGVTLTAKPGRTVVGFVQKQTGRVHAFGEVQYRVKEAGMTGTVIADAEGRFAIPGMPRTDVEVWSRGSAIGAWGGAVSTLEQPRVLLTHVDHAYARR